jgi:hypothetical protein
VVPGVVEVVRLVAGGHVLATAKAPNPLLAQLSFVAYPFEPLRAGYA